MSSPSHAIPSTESAKSIKELLAPLVAIIVGIFMVILDATAVNVAVPELVKQFNSSLSVVQWTVTGYALAQAAVIPLAGWMSDRFGAKNIFIISIILFTIGSVLCALATTAPQLIVFRILQGLGGGMVSPIAFAVVYRLSPPDRVGSVMGLMGIPILLAPAIGPILSGWLVDYVAWEWIFLINLPVGIIAVILALRSLPKFPKQASTSIDILGMIFGPIAFAALSYGISEGGTSWTSSKTVTGLVIGGVALLLFIIVELTRKQQPLLELRVFKSFDFTRGILVQWIMQFAMFGLLFLIPYFLQRLMGMSAFEAGLWTLPHAIAAGIFMPIGGRLYDKVGPRPIVVIGLTIITIGTYMLTRITPQDAAIVFLIPRFLIGAGMGMSFLALNAFLMQSAPQHLVSRVTALTSAMQQVMTSFAVSGLTTLIVSRTTHYISTEGKKQFDATAVAFSDTYWVLAVIAVIGIGLGFTLNKPKKASDAQPTNMVIGE